MQVVAAVESSVAKHVVQSQLLCSHTHRLKPPSEEITAERQTHTALTATDAKKGYGGGDHRSLKCFASWLTEDKTQLFLQFPEMLRVSGYHTEVPWLLSHSYFLVPLREPSSTGLMSYKGYPEVSCLRLAGTPEVTWMAAQTFALMNSHPWGRDWQDRIRGKCQARSVGSYLSYKVSAHLHFLPSNWILFWV